MEWINSLNHALHFVEEHLTDEGLSVDEVAKVTAYSPFYLQRLFFILTDLSLSEYIRQRRLSMAGQELQHAGSRVIDVALRYGYETPESFQKAFRRFHGVTPSAAQRWRGPLRYLSPLQVKVELTGGSMMDYTVESMGELTVMGWGRRLKSDEGFSQAPKLWEEYFAKDMHRKVEGYCEQGFCFDEPDGRHFTYMIGVFCEPGTPVPEGFEMRTIAPHTWAKFRATGPIPGAIQKVSRQIYTEWLPNNIQYDIAEAMNIEIYTEGDMSKADYESEIWLPVCQKK